MELLYIWIEDYKNIQRKGFNFSPKYRFEFTPTEYGKDEQGNETVTGGELTCKETDFPDNFFGKGISNVTAIVGENGSGKSTLLEMITNVLEATQTKRLYIFNERYGGKIIFLDKIQLSLNNCNNDDIKKEDINNLNMQQVSYSVFYSPDINNYNTLEGGVDDSNVSTTNLLENNSLRVYQMEELNKQISFLATNFSDIKKISSVSFINNKKLFVNIEPVVDYRLNYILENNKEISLVQYIELLMTHVAKEKNIELTNSDDNELKTKLNKCFNNEKISLENRLKETQNLITSFKMVYVGAIDKIIDFETLDFNSLPEWFKKYKDISLNEFKQKGLYLNIADTSKELKDLINKCINFPFNVIKFNYYIENNNIFSRYFLSSGENSLLRIFSRIYHLTHTKVFQPKLICIDEGEKDMHPHWQKEYLKNLIDVLPKIFEGKQIQIILTSHSPFLVSDLPKENIIFLAKGENGKCVVKDSLNEMKQTFGANIHTLLTDSFFLHDKGLMGKFAEGKINDVIDWLNKGSNENIAKLAKEQEGTATQAEKELKLVEWFIKQIGEPIIRNQLQKMLDSRRLAKVETHDEQIAKLEGTVRFLQKEIEQLKNKK